MARHTFVTVSHLTGDETRTVDILTRADVKNIVAEVIGLEIGDIDSKMEAQERKLAKMSVQAASAAKIAAVAQREIEKIVETARETFQGVIKELLAPHYRLLAQHLGVELPMEKAKQKIETVKPCLPVAVKKKKDDAKPKPTSKTRKAAAQKKTVMPSKIRTVAAKRNKAKKRPTSSRKAK